MKSIYSLYIKCSLVTWQGLYNSCTMSRNVKCWCKWINNNNNAIGCVRSLWLKHILHTWSWSLCWQTRWADSVRGQSTEGGGLLTLRRASHPNAGWGSSTHHDISESIPSRGSVSHGNRMVTGPSPLLLSIVPNASLQVHLKCNELGLGPPCFLLSSTIGAVRADDERL